MSKVNKIAIEAIRKQLKIICIDANGWDQQLVDYPYAEACSKKRKELLNAISELEMRNNDTVSK
jgi:hypothetical protein